MLTTTKTRTDMEETKDMRMAEWREALRKAKTAKELDTACEDARACGRLPRDVQ